MSERQVTEAFKAELEAVLYKYGAELMADEHEHIIATIQSKHDDEGNCIREFAEIDLGLWFPMTAI